MILSKDDIYFQDIKLKNNGYFTGFVDAWDIPVEAREKIEAGFDTVLEIDGYAYFDGQGLIHKVSGLLVWNGNKSTSILPTMELVETLEKQYIESL